MGEDVRGLQIQLSAALKERDDARKEAATHAAERESHFKEWSLLYYTRIPAIESERDALRVENGRLRSALMLIVAPVPYSENAMIIVQNMARAALAGGGDRG